MVERPAAVGRGSGIIVNVPRFGFSGGAEVYNPCPFPVALPFFLFAVAGANMYKEKLKDTPKEALNWRLWFTVFGTPALLSQWPFNQMNPLYSFRAHGSCTRAG